MYEDLLTNIDALYTMYKNGSLGGEFMPEDANPGLENSSNENYLYFTLPMALNYQRNSYTLWENANKTYADPTTKFVFDPKAVLESDPKLVQQALTKYQVAIQKNKQTEIWIRLCKSIVELFDGDIRKLFSKKNYDVNKIRDFIQKEHRKEFPYLAGNKICNYWLYVLWQYTDIDYPNPECLTVAADTHVIKATHRLGLITDNELTSSNVQLLVMSRWKEVLKGTKYRPIDIHTPLWLWSRNNFKKLTLNNPFQELLTTCYYVSNNSTHVTINEKNLALLAKKIDTLSTNHWLSTNPYGLLDLDIPTLVNFLVIYGSINCCYWGEPKWTIETSTGTEDGAFALLYALLKLQTKNGHLDFEKITFTEFKEALKGNVEIPFLKERYERIKNISHIINTKMSGNFYNYVKKYTTDIQLFNIIINNFPEFADKRLYNNKEIYFYKLAQLLTADILHFRELKENISVDYSHLVGCADYKIPQLLRATNILEYDEELSTLVDQKIELAEGSPYEVEIRANMLVAIDKLHKLLPNKSSIHINNLTWSLSHDKNIALKPYHRTKTMTY